MNKSYRIKFDPLAVDNTYINIKLEQDVETLEMLTMSLNTKDVYRNFNSDYGVLVGRVIANDGIGIPNTKISIFIPLAEEDETNKDIVSIYPYKTPRDKNINGKRYNLLPRVGQYNSDGTISPKQPFGSFPIKPEIVTNVKYMNVYKKYYKYTATTNDAGDYMIFGVPVGTHTVHMSVDITDIGEYSMNPAAMVVNLGYSPNLFIENNTKIKPSSDLDDLPHIETQEISVDIIPFWGDTETFEIGITQQNFRIRSVLTTTFTVFGSVFTDGIDAMYGGDTYSVARRIGELYAATNGQNETIGMYGKRIGIVSEKIYGYNSNVSDEQIDSGEINPVHDITLLDKTQYTSYKRDGDFVFIINCNRNKITKDVQNNEIPIPYDSSGGVFTEFRGFIILEFTVDNVPMTGIGEIGSNTRVEPYRFKLKFPQYAGANMSITPSDLSGYDSLMTEIWRKQSYTFKYNKYYSLSRFHGLTYNTKQYDDDDQFPVNKKFFKKTIINDLTKLVYDGNYYNAGIILTGDYGVSPEGGVKHSNSEYNFPNNGYVQISGELVGAFGANWMNFSVYLPQMGELVENTDRIKYVRTVDLFSYQGENIENNNKYFLKRNTQLIAGGDFNTQFIARSDLNWTDFIEVPIGDLKILNKNSNKGLIINSDDSILEGNYKYGMNGPEGWPACPFDGGKINGNPIGDPDPNIYIYKGFDDADCIQYLFELGLIK